MSGLPSQNASWGHQSEVAARRCGVVGPPHPPALATSGAWQRGALTAVEQMRGNQQSIDVKHEGHRGRCLDNERRNQS